MSRSPMKSERMMTVNIYEMMCEVTKYVGINIHEFAEVVKLFFDDTYVSRLDGEKDRNKST